MADDPRTVQQRVLDELEHHFANVVATQPADDPYRWAWAVVVQREIGPPEKREATALSVLFLDETPERSLHCYDKQMRVSLEFRVHAPPGEDAERVMNDAAGEVQRRMYELAPGHPSRPPDTLALDVTDAGYEAGLVDEPKDVAEGTCYFLVRYRHGLFDPRTPHA